MLLDLVYKLTRIKKLHDIRIVILALPCNRTLVNRTVFYFCFPLYYLYLYLYNINISHMTSKLIHFLIEKKFEVWRFAVTSYDIITGMEIRFATITSSFTSVDCMSKRDTGNVSHGGRVIFVDLHILVALLCIYLCKKYPPSPVSCTRYDIL
jgi:hypothetical protein